MLRCRSNSFHMSLCKKNEVIFLVFSNFLLEFAIISSSTQRWRDSTNNYCTQNGRPFLMLRYLCPLIFVPTTMSAWLFPYSQMQMQNVKKWADEIFAHRFSGSSFLSRKGRRIRARRLARHIMWFFVFSSQHFDPFKIYRRFTATSRTIFSERLPSSTSLASPCLALAGSHSSWYTHPQRHQVGGTIPTTKKSHWH